MRYQDLPSAVALARYAAALNARARAAGAQGQITIADLRDVLLSSGGRCEWCGVNRVGETFEVDHIQPLGRGGAHARTNLALSCEGCNRQKGSKEPTRFALELLAASGEKTPLIARILRAAQLSSQVPVQTSLLPEDRKP